MSVFRGSIIECPEIIIDHFIPSNCHRGRAFFLSHCHRDHMTGLDSNDLLFALKSKATHLYCSEVTKGLLAGDPNFTKLVPFMKPLPIQEQTTIKLNPSNNEKAWNISVTLLPAGHCPGSVMFLLQWEDVNVLYTGDFRLSVEELKSLSHLHGNGHPINIDTLYLDTTFCHEQAQNIISREKTRQCILEIIHKWLSADELNSIYLDCPSFGYEHILVAVSMRFNAKIHTSSWRMNSYSNVLPEVQQCLTLDGNSTRIHSCRSKKGAKIAKGQPCGSLTDSNGRPTKVLKIKPSTQWFVTSNGRLSHPTVFMKGINMVRVQHSMHASYMELCDFITYLSPRSVVPCVIPYSVGDTSIVSLHERIRKLLPVTPTDSTSIKVPQPHPFPNDTNNDSIEEVTVQRKDPVSLMADNDDNVDDDCIDSSDYDTDDEFACSEDWLESMSRDHASCDKSVDQSFDLCLPAFVDTDQPSPIGISHDHRQERQVDGQPFIDLSFDEDETDNDQKCTPFCKAIAKTKRHLSLNYSDKNLSKRIKTDECDQFTQSSDATTKSIESSQNTSIIDRPSPLSPVSIIDLTRSSSSGSSFSSNSDRDSTTPDSAVVYIGTSQKVPLRDEQFVQSPQQPLLSTMDKSSSTPVKATRNTNSPPGSPWFHPPTPGRTTNDERRIFSFGNHKSLNLF